MTILAVFQQQTQLIFYLDVAARVKAVQLVDQLQHGSLNLSEKLDQDVLWFKLRWFQHSFKIVD